MAFTQSGEKTAINCLSAHDWKLDVAVDNYFQFPERYNKDPKQALDKKKIESLFNRYKGYCCIIIYTLIPCEYVNMTHLSRTGS